MEKKFKKINRFIQKVFNKNLFDSVQDDVFFSQKEKKIQYFEKAHRQ